MLQLRGSISDLARALFTRVHFGRVREEADMSLAAEQGTVVLSRSEAGLSTLTEWLEVAGGRCRA